jgi:hypothetical protein
MERCQRLLVLLLLLSLRVTAGTFSLLCRVQHASYRHLSPLFSSNSWSGECADLPIALAKINARDFDEVCSLCMEAFFDEGQILHDDMINRGSNIKQEFNDCCDILRDKIGDKNKT